MQHNFTPFKQQVVAESFWLSSALTAVLLYWLITDSISTILYWKVLKENLGWCYTEHIYKVTAFSKQSTCVLLRNKEKLFFHLSLHSAIALSWTGLNWDRVYLKKTSSLYFGPNILVSNCNPSCQRPSWHYWGKKKLEFLQRKSPSQPIDCHSSLNVMYL